MYHTGVPAGHFSHVLIDEAGHAEEPLQMCALAGLVTQNTRVVMAGAHPEGAACIGAVTGRPAGRLECTGRIRDASMFCCPALCSSRPISSWQLGTH